jgi:hypothetical protein
MTFSPIKMTRAKEILQAYNDAVAEGLRFPIDELETRLNRFGAINDEDLEQLTWEQLQEIGIPKMKAVQIARDVFRSQNQMQPVPQPATQHVVMRTMSDEVSELSNEQLIQRFAATPSIRFSAVAEQIRARSGDRKCIAYLADGNVNVTVSVMVLNGIMQNDDFGDSVRVSGGDIEYLYRVSELPGNIRDEHPAYAGQVLRSDGTDRHGVYWGDVSLECRQLIRFAKSTGELHVHNRDDLLDLVERAKAGVGLLGQRYPKAHRLYKDAIALGNLPSLRIRASSATQPATSDAA